MSCITSEFFNLDHKHNMHPGNIILVLLKAKLKLFLKGWAAHNCKNLSPYEVLFWSSKRSGIRLILLDINLQIIIWKFLLYFLNLKNYILTVENVSLDFQILGTIFSTINNWKHFIMIKYTQHKHQPFGAFLSVE